MARQKGVLKNMWNSWRCSATSKIKGQEGYFAGMVGGPSGSKFYQLQNLKELERT